MTRLRKVEVEVKENPPTGGEKKQGRSYHHAHGRRKTATARVRIYADGKGEILVNEIPIEKYFPGEAAKVFYEKPLKITGTLGKVDATIKVLGSGKGGQLGAVVHGLSRTLLELNPQFRTILKKEGLLTRDPRAKERRKYGLAQKARKGKQHPKR